jgi:hypothetical protein
MAEMKIAPILVGKLERKMLLWRPKCRWGDSKTYFKKIGCESVDWIHVAHDRV